MAIKDYDPGYSNKRNACYAPEEEKVRKRGTGYRRIEVIEGVHWV
jgi:hypothetical protein